jgi:hypothetical protein
LSGSSSLYRFPETAVRNFSHCVAFRRQDPFARTCSSSKRPFHSNHIWNEPHKVRLLRAYRFVLSHTTRSRRSLSKHFMVVSLISHTHIPSCGLALYTMWHQAIPWCLRYSCSSP